MSQLKAWQRGFQLALSRELLFRLNFFIGRLREFVIFATLLFVYQALPQGLGGYTHEQLLSYILLGALISSPLFVYGMHQMAAEISEGEFTNYLLRPLSYFGYWSARMLASRLLLVLSGIVVLGILLVLFQHLNFFWQTDPIAWLQTGILLIGSLVFVQVLDFLGSVFSFWMPRAHGPRWLIMTLTQFLSGAYVPLDLFPGVAKTIFVHLPFSSIVYGTIRAWIHPLSWQDFGITLLTQWVWIFLSILLLRVTWKRGVRRYEAYGR